MRLQAWRNPMIAPAAMNRSDPSNDIVTWFKPSGLSLYMPSLIQAVPHTLSIRGRRSHGSFSGQNQPRIGAQAGAPAISCTFMNRSEEHTSELQSHSFISYAVFCLQKQKKNSFT